MCQACDCTELLNQAGVRPSQNRLMVMNQVLKSPQPLSSQELLVQTEVKQKLNKVTMYRILDLLVGKGLLNRLSSPDRTDRFCINESKNHPHHVHFFCEICKKMSCLPPESVVLEPINIDQGLFSRINNIQVLLDGICKECDW